MPRCGPASMMSPCGSPSLVRMGPLMTPSCPSTTTSGCEDLVGRGQRDLIAQSGQRAALCGWQTSIGKETFGDSRPGWHVGTPCARQHRIVNHTCLRALPGAVGGRNPGSWISTRIPRFAAVWNARRIPPVELAKTWVDTARLDGPKSQAAYRIGLSRSQSRSTSQASNQHGPHQPMLMEQRRADTRAHVNAAAQPPLLILPKVIASNPSIESMACGACSRNYL